MCLGVPLKIVEINGKNAMGEMSGVRTKVRVDLIPEIALGDYVMVHAGFAIEKMKEKEALNTLEIFKEIKHTI